MINARHILVVAYICLAAIMVLFAQSRENEKVNDNSDWWSIIRDSSAGEGITPEEQDVADSNFRVLSVSVGSDELAAIQKKLGPAASMSRGDASSARSQICYAGLDGRTYLAFETGEVQYAFYLFDLGPEWSGRDQCANSERVTSQLRTASGLHLGQSRAEVRAVLGKPTVARQDGDWVYFRHVRKKTSVADLKKARQYNPNLSNEKFHENCDFYDLSIYIVAKFTSEQLVYLGVSKSETY